MARIPKNYDGTALTSKCFDTLLPKVLSDIQDRFKDRPDLILAAWPIIIGSELAKMTEAKSFENGVLAVTVKDSTLFSLLNGVEKSKLLSKLKSRFPNLVIKQIYFRMG